jgi:phosphoribosylanthranilate isomerase
MKLKVYAADITNLTDARYFAAMGADYLGFHCDEGHPSFIAKAKIREIMDWVEGPQGILFFSGWQDINIMESLLNITGCTGLHVGLAYTLHHVQSPILFRDALPDMVSNFDSAKDLNIVIRMGTEFLSDNPDEVSQLYKLCREYSCFLDFGQLPENLLPLLEEIQPSGIVLRGGAEEKTGVKSFDYLDALFDTLQG